MTEFRQRHPVEQHLPVVRFAQPGGDRGQHGLSGTGPADHRDGHPTRHDQVDAVQQRRFARERAHAPEFQLPWAVGQGTPAVFHRIDGEDFARTARAGAGARDPAEHAGKAAEADAHDGVLTGREQIAWADPEREQREPARDQHRDDHQRPDHFRLGHRPRHHQPAAPALFVQLGQGFENAALFLLDRARCRDRPGTGKGFGEPAGDSSLDAQVRGDDFRGALGEGPQDQRDQGESPEKRDREPRIYDGEQDQAAHRG